MDWIDVINLPNAIGSLLGLLTGYWLSILFDRQKTIEKKKDRFWSLFYFRASTMTL